MFKKMLSNKPLSNFNDLGLLLLRITFGGLMLLNHGLGKMDKLLAGGDIKFADPIGLGMEISLQLTIFAEVICAGLLVLGLFTRLTLIPLMFTMLVAVFVMHWTDSFGDKEGALLYLIPYIILFVKGSGKYSIDNYLFKK
ncbi:MAG: putative oxidoreductase [Cognaticolwellia sp.]|jgi:putative oxidoreductase|tara:strand:- start:405 stop:824 length:420 start_codon:yes stop_codon:yes gene_type:complete